MQLQVCEQTTMCFVHKSNKSGLIIQEPCYMLIPWLLLRIMLLHSSKDHTSWCMPPVTCSVVLKKSINFWKLVNCNSENYVTPDHIATKWWRYIQVLGQFSRLNFTYWEAVIPIACISSTLGGWKGLVEKIPISEGNDPHRELWPNV